MTQEPKISSSVEAGIGRDYKTRAHRRGRRSAGGLTDLVRAPRTTRSTAEMVSADAEYSGLRTQARILTRMQERVDGAAVVAAAEAFELDSQAGNAHLLILAQLG